MKPFVTILTLIVLLIGGLSLIENTAQAADNEVQVCLLEADAVTQPGCQACLLLFRRCCTDPWQRAGRFNCRDRADASAKFLRLAGYEVSIQDC